MRLRLIFSFILIMLVSIISMSLIARQQTAREVSAFMFRGAMIDVDTLVDQLEDYYALTGNWGEVASLLQPFTAQGRALGTLRQGMGMGAANTLIRLADEQGNIVFNSDANQTNASLTNSEQNNALPLRSGGRIRGYLLVESNTGMLGSGVQLVSRLNQAALTAALIAGGLALLLAIILSDRLIRPVNTLTQAASRLARGDLSQRVTVKGDDEVAELGRTFNNMADSLQHAEESRRAMTADIAHELRTPLSVQRAHLEALQDGVFPLTSENLQPILEQNLLLTRLVDDLRTLALADSGQLEMAKTPTDFLALVRRIIERYGRPVQAQGVQLQLDIEPDLMDNPPILMLDPLRIEQILGNLLSNAQRYTPAGGNIVVKIFRIPSAIALSVTDSGPGIPPQSLPYIFERFYRADPSRSRAEGGTGLGLAIAKQLAEISGGNLQAANAQGGGATFTLELPLPVNYENQQYHPPA